MDFLFFCLIFLGMYFIILTFISPSWELYIEWGNDWEKLAKKGEVNAEALFNEDFEPSNPAHDLRVLFIRGWNKDILRWRRLADMQYNKVPKWYLKLRNKK